MYIYADKVVTALSGVHHAPSVRLPLLDAWHTNKQRAGICALIHHTICQHKTCSRFSDTFDMGNQQTREARRPGSSESPHGAAFSSSTPSGPSRQSSNNPTIDPTNNNNLHSHVISRPDRARNRLSRADIFGSFALSSTSSPTAQRGSDSARSVPTLTEATITTNAPFQRKETRQEREARRKEKHAAQRLLEREKSQQTEGVDGGYLVTLGTYTGPEDFDKEVVRHLQVCQYAHCGSAKALTRLQC